MKHGITEADIAYVFEYAVNSLVLRANPEKIMLFGFDSLCRGLEVGYIIDDRGEDIVIHAMKVRSVYKEYLYGKKGMRR
ncbi:MAG: toxin [Acidobacteriota bacterium]|nr:toxin [Acidobacteriota bacterium]